MRERNLSPEEAMEIEIQHLKMMAKCFGRQQEAARERRREAERRASAAYSGSRGAEWDSPN